MSSKNVGVTSDSKPTGITDEILSNIWRIDYPTASCTLEAKTQMNGQGGNEILSRHFGTNDQMLRYKIIGSGFYAETFFVTGIDRSTHGYTCMKIFALKKGCVKVYPMIIVSEYPQALKSFVKDVGATEILVAYPHPVYK